MNSPRSKTDNSLAHADPEPGRVVAAFGRHVLVEDTQGERHRCMIAGRRLRPVCGDQVRWARPADQSNSLLVAIEPRKNELARPSRRGQKEVLAANIDQLMIVVAAVPQPDPFIVDRYLAAAELMDASACVVLNKCELEGAEVAIDLKEFEQAGYPTFFVSAETGESLDRLADSLRRRTSIFVGQSGVGKSSLLNALMPGLELAVDQVSSATGEGKHTTTASVLHHLKGGGEIIDSPGVRDFSPPTMDTKTVAQGFREISQRSADCRFSDCMHLKEPDCAIKQAVDAGKITARRYESYRRLVRLMEQLGERG
ncbi:MAG: ribosome small subunit-dependent GTPase A [Gammaproteobacteria bacterium]